jgi:hypothetical protein
MISDPIVEDATFILQASTLQSIPRFTKKSQTHRRLMKSSDLFHRSLSISGLLITASGTPPAEGLHPASMYRPPNPIPPAPMSMTLTTKLSRDACPNRFSHKRDSRSAFVYSR